MEGWSWSCSFILVLQVRIFRSMRQAATVHSAHHELVSKDLLSLSFLSLALHWHSCLAWGAQRNDAVCHLEPGFLWFLLVSVEVLLGPSSYCFLLHHCRIPYSPSAKLLLKLELAVLVPAQAHLRNLVWRPTSHRLLQREPSGFPGVLGLVIVRSEMVDQRVCAEATGAIEAKY